MGAFVHKYHFSIASSAKCFFVEISNDLSQNLETFMKYANIIITYKEACISLMNTLKYNSQSPVSHS